MITKNKKVDDSYWFITINYTINTTEFSGMVNYWIYIENSIFLDIQMAEDIIVKNIKTILNTPIKVQINANITNFIKVDKELFNYQSTKRKLIFIAKQDEYIIKKDN